MKNKLLIFCMLLSIITFAQVPSYYNDVNLSQSGTALKDDLAVKISSTHTTFLSYTPGVWDALKQADLDPNNLNNVLLIYGYSDTDNNFKTDRTRGKDSNGGGTGLWNREHSYPKSLGLPNLGTSGPGSDAHHLRASDVQMNADRSNRKYADGNGNATITAQGYFYPGDEWKGDVARMMLYMYLRYGNRCLPKNVGVGTAVSGDTNMINLFLEWNVEDPVNTFEDQRNQVISGIQGNRNPFIDNPAFATQIWGGPQAEDRFGAGGSDTEAPSIPSSLVASNTTSTATSLSWSASVDNVAVTGYNVYQNGNLITSVTSTSYNVLGLTASTAYAFTVSAKDQAGNVSGNSNTASITTSGSGGGSPTASELFISEYVEGSSNNKAIEIANFTGSTVNLSAYSLRKQTNGSGGWSSDYTLSGSVANGNVFVVANSSASTTLKNNAEATTTNTALTFNGNDPVGLFKNGVLIDIVGTYNGGTANFAKDKTLRRKASINSPTTTYTISQWNTYNQDTFTDVGSHTVDGGTTTTPPTPPSVTYCSTKGNSVADEYIDYVSIGGISNSSGANGGYKDNTNLVGNVSYGSNTIIFSTGFSGQAYTEFWKVWIDYNKNGIFEGTEEVASGSSSSANNLSETFTIPSSALSGTTRMRVSMKYNAAPTPCETFSYGEVEDYTLNIGVSAKSREEIKAYSDLEDEASVYDVNIFNQFDDLVIKMKDGRVVNYSIYSSTGRIVSKEVFSETLKLSTLESGMYIIHINDGQRTIQKKFLKK